MHRLLCIFLLRAEAPGLPDNLLELYPLKAGRDAVAQHMCLTPECRDSARIAEVLVVVQCFQIWH